MALYDLVRCKMALPAEITAVTEWRTRSFGRGFQTFEIDGDGALRLFRLERQLHDDHPPRPALLDPDYTDWLRTWTRLETGLSAMQDFNGVLTLEGRDTDGEEWMIETKVVSGQCEPFRISRGRAELPAVAA
ncbi:MAG: hypothetical protein ACU0A8_10060 [Limimaricola soesokkakensis]|uniref:hypothetical protein n=1 Tax=Limimaricola soesokkakensis TaxID=1343159 RepID=UPI0040596C07